MNILFRKAIGSLLFLAFAVVPAVLLTPGMFRDIVTATAFILMLLINLTDMIIRPLASGRDARIGLSAAIGFLLIPVFIVLPYLENTWIIIQYAIVLDREWAKWTGVVIMLLGGFVLITSRIVLGQFGTPEITIQKGHRLVRSGLYRSVRHPMYLGDLILVFGYCLAFGGYLSAILETGLYFLLALRRMNREEALFAKRFGAKYRKYVKESDRLIPGIY